MFSSRPSTLASSHNSDGWVVRELVILNWRGSASGFLMLAPVITWGLVLDNRRQQAQASSHHLHHPPPC